MAFFLGGFGAHKFYLGQTGQGIMFFFIFMITLGSRFPAVQRANPFKKSGIKKYKDFDLDGAIVDFNKGLEINPQDVALHFNIANAYSLTEQKEKAYYHLAKAVEMGFSDTEMINTKDDLAFVRIQPEWDTFKANGYISC